MTNVTASDRKITTVTVPLYGIGRADPRIDGLLSMIDDWAEDNEIQSPIYTIETEEALD